MEQIKPRSLFLAPMEGITDMLYRKVIHQHFDSWDYVACDFLRVPSQGVYPAKHIIKHYGLQAYEDERLRNKTLYQILTSENAFTKEVASNIHELGIPWLDLNLGCPSKTVVKRRGGSFLLSEPRVLANILKEIRESFHGRFSVKIRIGFEDDKLFESNLKVIQDAGVELVTIHGRTREQLYKGVANWDYIKKAVNILDIPVVGNGDIWTLDDINRIFDYTNCHSVMIARGAMKAPWLANLYKNELYSNYSTAQLIKLFINSYYKELSDSGMHEHSILRRFKALTRYMYDDLKNNESIKSSLLRSSNLNAYLKLVESI